jgi:CHAT domain-containing protein
MLAPTESAAPSSTGPCAIDAARRMIDAGWAHVVHVVAPLGVSPQALAWALKDECTAAWSTDPQRAAQAAQLLRALCNNAVGRQGPLGSAGAQARELAALADWTAGMAQLTKGQMAEAEHSLDSAASGFRSLGQAAHAAHTQVSKIMALSMLGRHDEAVACAETAQQELAALGQTRIAGKVSINLGALHVQRGDFAQAVHHSRKAAVWFARVGDHEHSIMADINMAYALASLGDFDEALRVYARAGMRARQHAFPVLQGLVDMSVALLKLARGQYREALAGFEAARRQYEQLDHPPNLAIAEKQLADTYLELRLLPEAAALYEKVLQRFRSLEMLTEEAWTLAQCGRVQALLLQPTLAAGSFERAGALFAAQANGVGSAAVQLARAELALSKAEMGSATALATQAAQGFVAAGLADGQLRADLVRAHALLLAGSAEQARALFNITLASARKWQLLGVQVRCLTGCGLAAQALDDSAAAQVAFEAAIELLEEQRSALPDDELRSAFLSDHLLPYQGCLRLALQAHSHTLSTAHALAVLQQLERVRARSLGERVGQTHTPQPDAGAPALRDRLNWLHRHVQQLQEEGKPTAAMTDELRRTEHALLEGVRRARLSTQAPQTAPNPSRSPGVALDIQALQQALVHGDMLVAYGVQDDELFAVVVSHAGVQLQRRIASWRDVQEAARAASLQIQTLRHGAALMQQHLPSLTDRTQRRMARLHDLLWAPLQAQLPACRRLLLVAHGPLGCLPFAALHDGQQTLSERYDLAMVPSARMALRGLQRPANPPLRAVVLGESSRLPHAAKEARAVAKLFTESHVFVGPHASVRNLCRYAPEADVIHLACHAQFRTDNPLFSALHLMDGTLTVESTEALRLQAATVVLSACETALADHGGSDERVGLVRAFLLAGASRVVASLWPVDDEITTHFMAHFYAAMRHGQSAAAALRAAQNEVKQHHPHPFFWAAFTLHGGW